MSTLMEDRLTAALRARAELVQPEDLAPLDVPVTSLGARRTRTARRRRIAALAGLAAAACTAAVAGPLLLGGTGPDEAPAPAGPTEPQPTSSTERPLHVLEVDVDGDGTLDDARIVREDRTLELVVELQSGGTLGTKLHRDVQGPLLDAGDLGGGPGSEIVVPVSDRAFDLPLVYTLLDPEQLTLAGYPASGVEGWRSDVPQNRWTLVKNGLRTWEAESVPGDGRFPYWDWSLDDRGRLLPGPVQLGCAAPEDAPAPCRGEGGDGKGGPDVGPRGDLPTLMPTVDERLSDERYVYGPDFFGPGSDDYAQLQGDFEPADGAEDGHVELVVTTNGEEHRAPVQAGWGPVLVPRYLVMHGDAPVLVVERASGDTSFTSVFSFLNGELVELEPEGDVFLGGGVVDYQGELTEQRTWVTTEGKLFTAVLLDWETRRHHLWQWDVGMAVTPTDLGEACIDWETGSYGRCP